MRARRTSGALTLTHMRHSILGCDELDRGATLRGAMGAKERCGLELCDATLLAPICAAVPLPTLLVDFDLRVLHMNEAAEQLIVTDGDRGDVVLQRSGELLACRHSGEQRDGCGGAPECRCCVIRSSVRRAMNGAVVRRARAFVELERGGETRKIHLQVSAAPIEHEARMLAVLTLEDITELVQLRSRVAVCAGCGGTGGPVAK